MPNFNELGHLIFTGPAQRDKAIHTLEGILRGMYIDGHFNPKEIEELDRWSQGHRELLQKPPFVEIMAAIRHALADGHIDEEELADILWVIDNAKSSSEYYAPITNDIQQLHGMLHGITADDVISPEELRGLHNWILERDYLKGMYPYDEIESLIVATLRDGKIDDREHDALMQFFENFINYSTAKKVDKAIAKAKAKGELCLSRAGICAVDPEIIFEEKLFVCTGTSERASRKEFERHITQRSGLFQNSVTKKINYLIVGNMGSPAWAFACYGRKVEQAMQMRREGKGTSLLIVNEVDFWDSL